jgi:hypothetical protein
MKKIFQQDKCFSDTDFWDSVQISIAAEPRQIFYDIPAQTSNLVKIKPELNAAV